MAKYVSAEVRQKLENPIKLQWGTGGAGIPPVTIHGFQASLLIDVCQAIAAAAAEKELKGARYEPII